MTDLFDFFKENEDKLKETPSTRVWDQLEKQLEVRKRKRRRQLFLQLWMVGITVALLLIAAVVVYLRMSGK
jgi:hypothetical protein